MLEIKKLRETSPHFYRHYLVEQVGLLSTEPQLWIWLKRTDWDAKPEWVKNRKGQRLLFLFYQ
jgi:hypothetical protein